MVPDTVAQLLRQVGAEAAAPFRTDLDEWAASNIGAFALNGLDFGMKAGNTAFNNVAPLAAAMAAATAAGMALFIPGGRYSFWETQLPATSGQYGWYSAIVIPDKLQMFGVPGQTIFEFRTPVIGGNPAVPADVPLVPGGTTPMLRSTVYTLNNFAFINGHSYQCKVASGTTSSSAASQPSGLFEGTVTDGTVTWALGDEPYRGGTAVVFATNARDCRIRGITFDGLAPWVDGGGSTQPPPGFTYTFIDTGNFPKQFAQTRYQQCTYAWGYDVWHQALGSNKLGGVYGTGQDRNVFEDCTIINWRGEMYYGDGSNNQAPSPSLHTTLRFDGCIFEEGPVGISSSVGIEVERCTFRHMVLCVDRAQGTANFVFRGNHVEDCWKCGVGEQGLLNADRPGVCFFDSNTFINVYAQVIEWNLSFSAHADYSCIRAFRFENNDCFDCGWGGPVVQVAAGGSQFLPGGTARGVRILNNNFHVGAMVTNARTAQSSIATLGSAFRIDGIVDDLEIAGNRMIVEDAAIAGGHNFSQSILWEADALSSRVYVHHNHFVSQVGRVFTSMTTDQFFGLWKDNIEWSGTNPTTPGLGTYAQDSYAVGATVNPHQEVWGVGGSPGVVNALASLGYANRWEKDQVLRLYSPAYTGGGLHWVTLPASSATHRFKALRMICDSIELTVRRAEDAAHVPVWEEVSYINLATGKEPTANEVAPSFRTINSEAPKIQAWGCTKVSLTPSVATNFDEALNFPEGEVVQVTVNANTTLRHNVGGTTTPLFLAGGANFAPGATATIGLLQRVGDISAREVWRST